MSVHDGTQVDAGIFHHFHNIWVTEISNTLNGGLLPSGFYALTEQYAGMYVADLLTLQPPPQVAPPASRTDGGVVAVAEAPPKVRRTLTASDVSRTRRRTVAIRHVSGHRLVALVEIVSSANKDRPAHVEQFAKKAEEAVLHGIHLLLVDLFPPGRHDALGMAGVVWERLDQEPYELPVGEPLTLASFVADRLPVLYLEHLAVGAALPTMPLFLVPDLYVNLQLEPTYQAAYRGVPAVWRDVLQGRSNE